MTPSDVARRLRAATAGLKPCATIVSNVAQPFRAARAGLKRCATIVVAVAIASVSFRAAAPIRVMILDGESGGPYHNWQLTTQVLKKELDDPGLFQVDVVTAPPAGSSFSTFKPDFPKYQAVVLNYDAPDERWPADLKAAFERYVTDGGGLVVVHASDNAFLDGRRSTR